MPRSLPFWRAAAGLKGTLSEAELQVLRAGMLGGLRNKAARGELRIPLPTGLLWGEALDRIAHREDGKRRAAATARSEGAD